MSDRNVAVVTGASSGIGMETALAYARRGYAVALAARRVDKLHEVARRCQEAQGAQSAEATLVVPADVADEGQVQALVAQTLDNFGRIDVMVNNAGFGLFARVDQTDSQEMRRIFDVNFFGAFYGCKAVSPTMIRQRSGHIFNVSSVAGKRGTPFHGAYCATKFALQGLTDSFRVEMAPYNVRVTAVCPSLTATEFFERSLHGRQNTSRFVDVSSMTPAARIGRRIAAVTGRNRPQIVFTFGGKLLVLVSSLCPRLADQILRIYYNDLSKNL